MDKGSSLEEPLRSHRNIHYQSDWKKPDGLQGPKRAIRLCLLVVILPGLLISVPLYLKYHVFDYQVYPIGISDMRLIDNKMSTTWCQKQILRANTTFNAFLMPHIPSMAVNRKPVSMVRHLTLTDDMKEYWGFYLLKGSTVTVSTCVRWPGASLIVIRGHRHLHECAYIGDDSSEELEELLEIEANRNMMGENRRDRNSSSPEYDQVNHPDLLKKFRENITFHDPAVQETANSYTFAPDTSKEKLLDEKFNGKQMQNLLNQLVIKMAMMKKDPKLKFGRNNGTYEQESDRKNTSKAELTSTELVTNVINQLQELGPRGQHLLTILRNEINQNSHVVTTDDADPMVTSTTPLVDNNMDEDKLNRERRDLLMKAFLRKDFNSDSEAENLAIEEGFVADGIADHHHILNETTLNDMSNSEFWSSFSSSEEALLNCAGLILSLPLNSHRKCDRKFNGDGFQEASLSNTISYTVPINGYYFFVFNSENEVQENYIQVNFNLTKTVYNVSNALSQCSNATNSCSLSLGFLSNEKVVFELPFKENQSMRNEEFIVVSECEPRTVIYLICVLSVPLIILIFAFY